MTTAGTCTGVRVAVVMTTGALALAGGVTVTAGNAMAVGMTGGACSSVIMAVGYAMAVGMTTATGAAIAGACSGVNAGVSMESSALASSTSAGDRSDNAMVAITTPAIRARATTLATIIRIVRRVLGWLHTCR